MRRGKAHTGFWWGNLRERDHLGDPGVDGMIPLLEYPSEMDVQDVGCVGVDWMELAQDRDRWRPLVNALMNLRVP